MIFHLFKWMAVLVVASGSAFATPKSTRGEEADRHWAFKRIVAPIPPQVENAAWPQNPIDCFVLAGLEKAGLRPAAAAEPSMLRRRISFALVGLPPILFEEGGELTTLIDRLLASPHYGERWARHWLDVVRYADSNGLDENAAHANAWRYRDYVIDRLNKDKPFDQFLIEQIAGDLLPASDATERRQQLVATGFLALGPKVLAEPDKVKMEMDIIDEQVDTIGKAFLGLTLGCARCHDHKFDPIPAADYYALAGIFKSTKTMDSFTTIAKWHENSIASESELQLRADHDAIVERQKQAVNELVNQANQALLASLNTDSLPDKPEEMYPQSVKEELAQLRGKLDHLTAAAPLVASAMGVCEGTVSDLPVFARGDHLAPGQIEARHFPRALVHGPLEPLGNETSGRLELAHWIASPDNPLTARVVVNRVWRWHFGRGLVATTDNFGELGEFPSHPELLDWLAAWFIDNGWSLKKLHRLILNSATYQMSSQGDPLALTTDPENRLYGRAPVRRLEAEPIRDALLAVAGLLDRRLSGASWSFKNYELVFDHTSRDATSYESNRRAIYLPVIRNHVYDMFELFDFPDPATVGGNRGASVIPPQSLFLMNSPLVLRSTQALADLVLADPHISDELRIERLYQAMYSRPSTPDERRRAVQFLAQFSAAETARNAPSDQCAAWRALCQTMAMANEFIYLP